jgi:C4-dicarboxylate-specific signal transduction histidine kinase
MEPQNGERFREMQLAYIGKLMAGLSHEFKNHLAIIRESSGLIEDLLSLEESIQSPNSERYKKIFPVITERITQAAEMCRFLSGFAHRMDHPLSSFSVTDILQEELYLLHRFARQKQVELLYSHEGDLPAIFNNPALLQFAVFCIVWSAFASFSKDGRISIKVKKQQQEAAVAIVIKLEGTVEKAAGVNPWYELLPEILHKLEAELSHTVSEGEEESIIKISSLKSRPRGNI